MSFLLLLRLYRTHTDTLNTSFSSFDSPGLFYARTNRRSIFILIYLYIFVFLPTEICSEDLEQKKEALEEEKRKKKIE